MSNEAINHVLRNSKTKSASRLLMVVIADLANDDGACYPGNVKLSQKCNCSKRSVQKLVDHCESMGELAVIEKGGINTQKGKTNLYVVLGLRYKTWQDVPGARTPNPLKEKQEMSKETPQEMSKETPQEMSKETPNPLDHPLDYPLDSVASDKTLSDEQSNPDASQSATPEQKQVTFDDFPSFAQSTAQHGAVTNAIEDMTQAIKTHWQTSESLARKIGKLLRGKFVEGSDARANKRDELWIEHNLETPIAVDDVQVFVAWYRDTNKDKFGKPLNLPLEPEGIGNWVSKWVILGKPNTLNNNAHADNIPAVVNNLRWAQ